MKAKKTNTAPKASKKIKALAKRLFDVGIAGWRTVDDTKTTTFKQLDHPGQIAGWYAIAEFVEEEMRELAKSLTE